MHACTSEIFRYRNQSFDSAKIKMGLMFAEILPFKSLPGIDEHVGHNRLTYQLQVKLYYCKAKASKIHGISKRICVWRSV